MRWSDVAINDKSGKLKSGIAIMDDDDELVRPIAIFEHSVEAGLAAACVNCFVDHFGDASEDIALEDWIGDAIKFILRHRDDSEATRLLLHSNTEVPERSAT